MAIDTSIPRSRRALLAGGVGGLAALAATALGRPLPASAADGDTVKIGGHYTATSFTRIDGHGLDGEILKCYDFSSSGAGIVAEFLGTHTAVAADGTVEGVSGFSFGGIGVAGSSATGVGVKAHSVSGPGVRGDSGTNDGVVGIGAASAKSGVYGVNSVGTGYGVFGRNTATKATGYLGGDGIGVMGTAPAVGVYGRSDANSGVFGWSKSGTGVAGWTGGSHKAAILGSRDKYGTGVYGYSATTAAAEPPAPFHTGVYGYADDTGSRGVTGQTTYGFGVYGIATAGRGVFGEATSGTGVRGYSESGTAGHFATGGPKVGTALNVLGKATLAHCAGVATIAAGTNNVTVTPGINLATTDAVVATLQGSPGRGTTTVQRVAVDARADTFTVYLTANAAQNVKVAWHVFG